MRNVKERSTYVISNPSPSLPDAVRIPRIVFQELYDVILVIVVLKIRLVEHNVVNIVAAAINVSLVLD